MSRPLPFFQTATNQKENFEKRIRQIIILLHNKYIKNEKHPKCFFFNDPWTWTTLGKTFEGK